MRIKRIRPEFVNYIPDNLENGVLYISIPYNTASHKCASGCNEVVVTPITPTDWTLVWDGDTVSLDPSIGNWSLPCRSHYWIRKNRVIWARKWDTMEVESNRILDLNHKKSYFNKSKTGNRKKM
ncbi:MAG: DUF6527 family protein [Thermoplasmataceae archaeon]